MSHVQRLDHVGITVADLEVVTAFFVGLGLGVEGRTFVEGGFLDTVSGIPDSRTEIVMLRPAGDEWREACDGSQLTVRLRAAATPLELPFPGSQWALAMALRSLDRPRQ